MKSLPRFPPSWLLFSQVFMMAAVGLLYFHMKRLRDDAWGLLQKVHELQVTLSHEREEIRRLEDLYVIFDDKLEHYLTRTNTTDARVFATMIEVRKMRKEAQALSQPSALKSTGRSP